MIRDILSREWQALAKAQKLGKASEPMWYLSELVLKNGTPSFRAALLCQHPQEHGMGATEDTNHKVRSHHHRAQKEYYLLGPGQITLSMQPKIAMPFFFYVKILPPHFKDSMSCLFSFRNRKQTGIRLATMNGEGSIFHKHPNLEVSWRANLATKFKDKLKTL